MKKIYFSTFDFNAFQPLICLDIKNIYRNIENKNFWYINFRNKFKVHFVFIESHVDAMYREHEYKSFLSNRIFSICHSIHDLVLGLIACRRRPYDLFIYDSNGDVLYESVYDII